MLRTAIGHHSFTDRLFLLFYYRLFWRGINVAKTVHTTSCVAHYLIYNIYNFIDHQPLFRVLRTNISPCYACMLLFLCWSCWLLRYLFIVGFGDWHYPVIGVYLWHSLILQIDFTHLCICVERRPEPPGGSVRIGYGRVSGDQWEGR